MNAYWESNGSHQELADQLELLIPTSGSVEDVDGNPELENFRRAGNAYYDIFNNGGGNRDDDITDFFGPRAIALLSDHAEELTTEFPAQKLYRITEPRMDRIVLAAAKEQGLA